MKKVFDFIKHDYQRDPQRFALEIVNWQFSMISTLIFTLTVPHPPLMLLYFIWLTNYALSLFLAYKRGSTGSVSNYFVLIILELAGFYRLLTTQ